jgi:hypothetical protein
LSEQVIWLNSELLQDGIPFHISTAIQAGLIYLRDLINEHGKFCTYDNIIEPYGQCITFLDYYAIVHSIPQYWKHLINCSTTGCLQLASVDNLTAYLTCCNVY